MLFGDILYYFYTLMNINFVPAGQKPDPISDLIRQSGYPVERHTILTEDGYILTMHRIPSRLMNLYHKPVLLVHALSSSGGQWVVSGNKSLAFMLSDEGRDVWILHNRGTSNSLKHRTLNPNQQRYWDFSWHEMGVYDTPAAIDYILAKTGRDKVHFIGHSQGPTIFFVLMSERPEYKNKIASTFLLQPAVLVHSAYPMFKEMVQSLMQISIEQHFYKIQIRNSLPMHLSTQLCSQKPLSLLCTNLGLMFLGGDTGQIADKHKSIQLLLKYVYDNMSIKQLVHYAQIHGSKKFRKFDYGPYINRNMYNGSAEPPEYDLSKADCATVVMIGTRDALTTEIDIKTITQKLPNVQEVIRLPWNHGDLILGKDSDKLHNRIIFLINKYEQQVLL